MNEVVETAAGNPAVSVFAVLAACVVLYYGVKYLRGRGGSSGGSSGGSGGKSAGDSPKKRN